jgi:hypothetical protein
MGARALLKAWQGIVVSDVLSDIRSMLVVTAQDPAAALADDLRRWQAGEPILARPQSRLEKLWHSGRGIQWPSPARSW